MSFFFTGEFFSSQPQSRPVVIDRTIRIVNVAPVELSILKSLLALLEGRTQCRWRISDAAEADLVLLGHSATESATHADMCGLTVLLLGSRDTQPSDGTLTLRRPVRIAPFAECLEEAATRLRVYGTASSNGRVGAVASGRFSTLRAAADAVRMLSNPMTVARPFKLVGRDGSMLALGNFAVGSYFSAHEPAELVARMEREFERALPATMSAWNTAQREGPIQSLEMLCWRLGKRLAARSGLAPWLNSDQAYSLLRWPDFAAIGEDPAGFQLASRLAQSRLTARQLAVALPANRSEIKSFLTSASLSGLLVAGTAHGPRRHSHARMAGPAHGAARRLLNRWVLR